MTLKRHEGSACFACHWQRKMEYKLCLGSIDAMFLQVHLSDRAASFMCSVFCVVIYICFLIGIVSFSHHLRGSVRTLRLPWTFAAFTLSVCQDLLLTSICCQCRQNIPNIFSPNYYSPGMVTFQSWLVVSQAQPLLFLFPKKLSFCRLIDPVLKFHDLIVLVVSESWKKGTFC